ARPAGARRLPRSAQLSGCGGPRDATPDGGVRGVGDGAPPAPPHTTERAGPRDRGPTVTRGSVVVVGAGIGGISAALHLARAGVDVTILEKDGAPGGRCGRLVRDGHRFDTGP